MSGLRLRAKTRQKRMLMTLRRLANWRPNDLLASLASIALERARARILSTKVAPSGESWPRWSPRYDAWRAKHAPTGGILFLSGELEKSLEIFETKSAGGRYSALMGSALVYAAAHNSPSPKSKLPKREFLGLSSLDREEVRQKILDAMKREAR
jgi:phage gpG-like protein